MFALLLASLLPAVSAKSFLQGEVGVRAVESLLSELSGQADRPRNFGSLQEIESELEPIFVALPKNSEDRLEPAAVRYALHRYFMHKHGWFVNGLGPANDTNCSSQDTVILKDRAPAFIQHNLEQRLHGKGLSQRDLAVFAATLTDLIHQEVRGSLASIYAAFNLPIHGDVTEEDYRTAGLAYMLAYFSAGEVTASTRIELSEVESEWIERYPGWEEVIMWADDLFRTTRTLQEKSHSNPFVSPSRTFEDEVLSLQVMGHQLGTFQNLECHRLKGKLVEMEDVGTGRVPLSRFYRNGLAGKWEFTESVAYLRLLGALDDRDPARMSVVIPNYLQSPSNCVAGSRFYRVCCLDECEGLFGHLEREIQASSASPTDISAVISRLPSDTVHAPRNLSLALQVRLEEIANTHGGQIPLHGRLFAQWMHHAYPRECRFPHVIGTVNRFSPNEWADLMEVETAEADENEMSLHVDYDEQKVMAGALAADALPWSVTEELIVGQLDCSVAGKYLALRAASLVVFLASVVVPTMRFWKAAKKTEGVGLLMQSANTRLVSV